MGSRRGVASMDRQDGHLILTVEDDGPGVPEEQLVQLGQRGRRLDEQRSENGIGLAVVSDIARRYGGKLTFSRSPLGGLRAGITLLEMHHGHA